MGWARLRCLMSPRRFFSSIPQSATVPQQLLFCQAIYSDVCGDNRNAIKRKTRQRTRVSSSGSRCSFRCSCWRSVLSTLRYHKSSGGLRAGFTLAPCIHHLPLHTSQRALSLSELGKVFQSLDPTNTTLAPSSTSSKAHQKEKSTTSSYTVEEKRTSSEDSGNVTRHGPETCLPTHFEIPPKPTTSLPSATVSCHTSWKGAAGKGIRDPTAVKGHKDTRGDSSHASKPHQGATRSSTFPFAAGSSTRGTAGQSLNLAEPAPPRTADSILTPRTGVVRGHHCKNSSSPPAGSDTLLGTLSESYAISLRHSYAIHRSRPPSSSSLKPTAQPEQNPSAVELREVQNSASPSSLLTRLLRGEATAYCEGRDFSERGSAEPPSRWSASGVSMDSESRRRSTAECSRRASTPPPPSFGSLVSLHTETNPESRFHSELQAQLRQLHYGMVMLGVLEVLARFQFREFRLQQQAHRDGKKTLFQDEWNKEGMTEKEKGSREEAELMAGASCWSAFTPDSLESVLSDRVLFLVLLALVKLPDLYAVEPTLLQWGTPAAEPAPERQSVISESHTSHSIPSMTARNTEKEGPVKDFQQWYAPLWCGSRLKRRHPRREGTVPANKRNLRGENEKHHSTQKKDMGKTNQNASPCTPPVLSPKKPTEATPSAAMMSPKCEVVTAMLETVLQWLAQRASDFTASQAVEVVQLLFQQPYLTATPIIETLLYTIQCQAAISPYLVPLGFCATLPKAQTTPEAAVEERVGTPMIPAASSAPTTSGKKMKESGDNVLHATAATKKLEQLLGSVTQQGFSQSSAPPPPLSQLSSSLQTTPDYETDDGKEATPSRLFPFPEDYARFFDAMVREQHYAAHLQGAEMNNQKRQQQQVMVEKKKKKHAMRNKGETASAEGEPDTHHEEAFVAIVPWESLFSMTKNSLNTLQKEGEECPAVSSTSLSSSGRWVHVTAAASSASTSVPITTTTFTRPRYRSQELPQDSVSMRHKSVSQTSTPSNVAEDVQQLRDEGGRDSSSSCVSGGPSVLHMSPGGSAIFSRQLYDAVLKHLTQEIVLAEKEAVSPEGGSHPLQGNNLQATAPSRSFQLCAFSSSTFLFLSLSLASLDLYTPATRAFLADALLPSLKRYLALHPEQFLVVLLLVGRPENSVLSADVWECLLQHLEQGIRRHYHHAAAPRAEVVQLLTGGLSTQSSRIPPSDGDESKESRRAEKVGDRKREGKLAEWDDLDGLFTEVSSMEAGGLHSSAISGVEASEVETQKEGKDAVVASVLHTQSHSTAVKKNTPQHDEAELASSGDKTASGPFMSPLLTGLKGKGLLSLRQLHRVLPALEHCHRLVVPLEREQEMCHYFLVELPQQQQHHRETNTEVEERAMKKKQPNKATMREKKSKTRKGKTQDDGPAGGTGSSATASISPPPSTTVTSLQLVRRLHRTLLVLFADVYARLAVHLPRLPHTSAERNVLLPNTVAPPPSPSRSPLPSPSGPFFWQLLQRHCLIDFRPPQRDVPPERSAGGTACEGISPSVKDWVLTTPGHLATAQLCRAVQHLLTLLVCHSTKMLPSTALQAALAAAVERDEHDPASRDHPPRQGMTHQKVEGDASHESVIPWYRHPLLVELTLLYTQSLPFLLLPPTLAPEVVAPLLDSTSPSRSGRPPRQSSSSSSRISVSDVHCDPATARQIQCLVEALLDLGLLQAPSSEPQKKVQHPKKRKPHSEAEACLDSDARYYRVPAALCSWSGKAVGGTPNVASPSSPWVLFSALLEVVLTNDS